MTLSPDDIVSRIIGSWQGYSDMMRAQDRQKFEKMMRKCYKYASSIEVKAEPFENDALFMALIFEQEQVIEWLLVKVAELERKEGGKADSNH
jgi:hypothetical protein